MRVAAIDVGTNTALLLVADVRGDGALELIQEEERFVRLGEGVDVERIIKPAAIERLRIALETYALLVEEADVDAVDVVGTSASRDASNGFELDHLVRATLGVPFRVISGEEEARLTCIGAFGMLPQVIAPGVVVDVGGGSTEIVLTDATVRPIAIQNQQSIDLGGVRLTERFFSSMPPGGSEVSHARKCVDEMLSQAGVAACRERVLVGTSGTARSLAMIIAGIGSWGELNGGPLTITLKDIQTWSRRLLSMSTHEVLSLNPRILAGRADILPAGVLILQHVMQLLEQDKCVVSRGGLKEGVALHLTRNNG